MKEIKNDKFLKMNDKKNIAKNNANYLIEMSCKKEYFLKKKTLQNRANNILKCLDFWQWDKSERKSNWQNLLNTTCLRTTVFHPVLYLERSERKGYKNDKSFSDSFTLYGRTIYR